jgi:hypothetical protein
MGFLMPQARCAHLDAVSHKWRLLADRRLRDMVELYKSGRWDLIFPQKRSCSTWNKLLL